MKSQFQSKRGGGDDFWEEREPQVEMFSLDVGARVGVRVCTSVVSQRGGRNSRLLFGDASVLTKDFCSSLAGGGRIPVCCLVCECANQGFCLFPRLLLFLLRLSTFLSSFASSFLHSPLPSFVLSWHSFFAKKYQCLPPMTRSYLWSYLPSSGRSY